MGNRVLVVDDEPNVVNVIGDALTREGFSVLSARDGAECLQKVESEQPDLVILDVNMPVMNGFKVLHALREREDTRNLPVVMLTVREQRGDVLAGWTAGADLYFTKPCNMKDLVAGVRRLLQAPAKV
ncbi:MAG: response regulator [Armatimonadota bacterium]|nr:MAG: response regulator [Armatimonadota bacterium]